MRKDSRYISAGIFGTMLLLPLLAMFFLQLGKAYIQSTREERLETETLVQVVLPASKVVWEEEEKELWVGNRMFDVASYTIIDDHYHVTGVYDDDETELAGSLLHLLLSKDCAGLLQLLLLLQCFTTCLHWTGLDLLALQSRKKIAFYTFTFLSPIHLVLGPPPRKTLSF